MDFKMGVFVHGLKDFQNWAENFLGIVKGYCLANALGRICHAICDRKTRHKTRKLPRIKISQHAEK